MNRYFFGLAKYGQPLMTLDSRNEVIDAEEEALDMIQYAYKAKLNGRIEELRGVLFPYIVTICALLDVSVVQKGHSSEIINRLS